MYISNHQVITGDYWWGLIAEGMKGPRPKSQKACLVPAVFPGGVDPLWLWGSAPKWFTHQLGGSRYLNLDLLGPYGDWHPVHSVLQVSPSAELFAFILQWSPKL